MKIIPLTEKEKINTGPVLIYFWAPFFKETALELDRFKELENNTFVKFYEVDADKKNCFNEKFKIKIVPSIVMLNNGVVVNRIKGTSYCREFIEDLLK